MRTAFIFHGVGGHPEENWFPWVKSELEKMGWQVVVPQFPNASRPTLASWLRDFDQYADLIDEKSILIGHSLGATFILRFLESYSGKIDTAAFVAGPIAKLHNDFDSLIASFIDHPFDWEKIRMKANRFVAFYGDNDPYVPLVQGKELAGKLHAHLTIVPGGGHLNEGSGHFSFPEILTALS